MKKTCKLCGGNYKETTVQHQIKTRNENRKELNIENLPIYECTICGTTELPEKSEEIISIVKNVVKRELDRVARIEQEIIRKQSNRSLFSILFKRFIS